MVVAAETVHAPITTPVIKCPQSSFDNSKMIAQPTTSNTGDVCKREVNGEILTVQPAFKI